MGISVVEDIHKKLVFIMQSGNNLQFFTTAKTRFLKLGPCLSKLHTQKPKSDTQNKKHLTFLAKVNTTFKII